MDPVTHTLTGAALARAGLARATPMATAALLIAANIPDVDVMAYVRGPEFALAFRRGWTHGVLALVLWPFVVAGLMRLWYAIRPGASAPRFWPLVGVAAVGVLSHPVLDWLNVYGMRWLMPFDGAWFYGDALFIVDPWVWAVLAWGVWAAGRTGPRPARAALAVFGLYAVVMLGVGAGMRRGVSRALAAAGSPPRRVLASPEPLTPLRRLIVAETAGGYRVGSFGLPGAPPAPDRLVAIVPALDTPAARAAAATTRGRQFLSWARFPLARVGRDTVVLLDARYALDEDAPFGTVKIAR